MYGDVLILRDLSHKMTSTPPALQFFIVDNRTPPISDFYAEASYDNLVKERHAFLSKYLLSQRDHAKWLPLPHVLVAEPNVLMQLSAKDIPSLARLVPSNAGQAASCSSDSNLSKSTWKFLISGLDQVASYLSTVVFAPPMWTAPDKQHQQQPHQPAKLSIVFLTSAASLLGSTNSALENYLRDLKAVCLELQAALPCQYDVDIQIVACRLTSINHSLSFRDNDRSAEGGQIEAGLGGLSHALSSHASPVLATLAAMAPSRLEFDSLLRSLLTAHAPKVQSLLVFPKLQGQEGSLSLMLTPHSLESADLIAPPTAATGAQPQSQPQWHDLSRPSLLELVPRDGLPSFALRGGSLQCVPAPASCFQGAALHQENVYAFAALQRLLADRGCLLVLNAETRDEQGLGVSSQWVLVPPSQETLGPGGAENPCPPSDRLHMTLLRLVPREHLLDQQLRGAAAEAEGEGQCAAGLAAEIVQDTLDYLAAALFRDAGAAVPGYNPLSHTSNAFGSEMARLHAAARPSASSRQAQQDSRRSVPSAHASAQSAPSGQATAQSSTASFASHSHSHSHPGPPPKTKAPLPALSASEAYPAYAKQGSAAHSRQTEHSSFHSQTPPPVPPDRLSDSLRKSHPLLDQAAAAAAKRLAAKSTGASSSSSSSSSSSAAQAAKQAPRATRGGPSVPSKPRANMSRRRDEADGDEGARRGRLHKKPKIQESSDSEEIDENDFCD